MSERSLRVLLKDLLMHEQTAPVCEEAQRVLEKDVQTDEQALR